MKLFLKITIVSLIFLWIFFSLYNNKKYINQNNSINIKQYTLTPNPSKIFLLNIKLSSIKDYNIEWIKWWSNLYFQAVDLFNTNIITLLTNTNDKKVVLKTHIAQLNNIKNKLENKIASIQEILTKEEINYNQYTQLKQEWDTNFSQWFITKDDELIRNWLKQSYINWPIATKHRILLNANKILNYKLNNIKLLIDAKLLLLTNNKTTILENFDLIKWNLLTKLENLKYKLENNYYN